MRYAIIDNGVVANIAEASPQFASSQGWRKAPAGCEIGWLFDGQEFTPPSQSVLPVPAFVTRLQAKLALLGAGLLDAAETALLAFPEPQNAAALIYWNEADTFRRDHELIAAMAGALNLTNDQVDDLFRTAATL